MEGKGKRMLNILKHKIGKLYREFFYHLPPGNYILFESAPDLADSAKPVFDEMVKRGLNQKYKLIWWVNDKKDEKLPRIDNVIYVDDNTPFHARQFQYYRFRAKCLVYCNKHLNKSHPEAKSFYITHGTAIKSIRAYYHAPEDLDYCFIASPHFLDLMSEENTVPPEKIISFGYPRNDDLSKTSLDLHAILQKDYDKVIVWYPTYRQHKRANIRLSGDSLPIIHDAEKAKIINNILVKRRVLIVIKPHFAQDISYVKDLNLSNILFIDDNFFVEHAITSYRFVGSCDALITDYSSIYFDYLLCNKPMGLVWEDIDAYRRNPGFSLDLDYYMKAAEKIYDADDLTHFIENVAIGCDSLESEREEINRIANYSDDGQNTKRVVDFIIDKAGL